MRSPCEAHAEAVPQTSTAPGESFCPQSRRRFVLISAILASALGFIDGSVVAIAVPAIRGDLGATLADAQWISNAYMLTLSALILAGGAAGDKFGLRRTFITGILLFAVASAICAVAPDVRSLILARAVQGIGAAIMVPCSLAIIAKAYPKKERGRAIGIWAAASALTTALGPVLGGFALSAFDDAVWRFIFAINLPIGGIAVYLLVAKVPSDKPTADRKLDLVGGVIATVALGSIAFGLTAATGEDGGGPSALVMPAIVLGLVVLGGFLLWERRQREPMIDLSLFRLRPFSGANASTFFLYFALSAVLFYLPMLLIAGWGLNEAATGAIFLPLSVAIALFSGPVGQLSDKIGPRLPIAVGSLVVGVAFAGLAVISGAGVHRFWTGVFPLMVVMGLGMALVVSPLSTAVMTAVEDEETGAASGINNAVARIAGLIAVAAMGGIAAWRYAGVLAGSGDAASAPSFGEPPAADLPARLDALRLAASDAAFSSVAWATAVLCLLSAAAAWLTVPGREAAAEGSQESERAGRA